MKLTLLVLKKVTKLSLALLLFLFVSVSAMAQNTYLGTVADESGQGILGANLLVQNTTNGVTTDENGSFSIAANSGDVLIISYIGFKTQTVVLGNQLDLQTITLIEEGVGLDEVIVTSRKVEESLQKVPISVTAFSAKNLQEKGLESIVDVGDFSPNVTLESTAPISGNNSALIAFIRGIGQTDFSIASEAGVGLYVDGVYIARNVGGVVDLLDIDRVEILKGPQGTLFGRNTIGGAINVVTKKPSSQFGVTGDITGGGFDQFNVRVTVDIPITDNLFSSFSISDKNQNGFVERIPFTGANNGDLEILGGGSLTPIDPTSDLGNVNNTTIRGKLGWYPTDNFKLIFSGDYTTIAENGAPNTLIEVFGQNDPASLISAYNASIAGLTPFTVNGESLENPLATPFDERFITGDPFTQFGNSDTGTDIQNFGFALTADWKISENVSLKSITSYRDLDSNFGEDGDSSPLLIDNRTFFLDQSQFTQEFQFTGSSEKLDWVAGLYYFEEDGFVENNVFLGGGLLLIDADNFVDTQSFAAFGQLNYDITDKLSVTGGVRFTSDDKGFRGEERELNGFFGQLNAIGMFPTELFPNPNDFTQLSPTLERLEENFTSVDFRAGIEYQFTDDILLYGSFAQGFKSGGFSTRLTAPLLEQPTFEPEEADTYELGLKSQFSNKLRLNATGFFTDYTNVQIVVQDGISPFLENAARAELLGLELELNYVPVRNLTLNGALGLLSAEYTEVNADNAAVSTDSQLVNAPATTLSLSGDLITPFQDGSRLAWHLDYNFKSEVANNTENTAALIQDAYGILNAAVTYRHKSDKWSLRVGVDNLTDNTIITSGFFQPGVGFTQATFNRPIFANATLGFKL